jgi:hypothetical protein
MSVVAGAILVVVLDAVVGLMGDVLVVGADDVVECCATTLDPAAIDDDVALDEPGKLMECNSVRCERSRDGYTHCSRTWTKTLAQKLLQVIQGQQHPIELSSSRT